MVVLPINVMRIHEGKNFEKVSFMIKIHIL